MKDDYLNFGDELTVTVVNAFFEIFYSALQKPALKKFVSGTPFHKQELIEELENLTGILKSHTISYENIEKKRGRS